MRILNFGSLNIDRSYHVPRFVRSGETLSSLRMESSCGGKGLNQSIALSHAGLEVWHAGKVGEDGRFLLEQLRRSGVDTSLVQVSGEVPTGHAVIQIDPAGKNCILLHGGANQAITPQEIDIILRQFGAGDWLFLQNEISCLDFIVKKALEQDMTVVLNPSPVDDRLLSLDLGGISWLILNEIEGEELTGLQKPECICSSLRSRWPDLKIVLTLGESGALCEDGSGPLHQDIFPSRVVDSTAAGDTFTGFFFAAVCRGSSTREALRLASMASALAVSRKGASASIPLLNEVEAALGQSCE